MRKITLYSVYKTGPINNLNNLLCLFSKIGMLVHGSGPTLSSRRMGLTVQFCPTNIKLDRPSNYEETMKKATEDFRKPILVAGEDTFGELEYFKFT